jgi:uncharacterized membrane protein YccC
MLTTRVKESVKTALAMVIAYGIALYMDWDRAYWAAFAVAFCSLSTIGQSLNKAAMRMVGTFLGIAVAFALIALFPQHRWLFILGLSLWVSFCAYQMAGPRVQYFWHVSAFVCGVVAIDAGPDAVNAFNTGILRAQETALGILVYSLVAVFLWPVRTGPQLRSAARGLASSQRRFLGTLLDTLAQSERVAELEPARAEETAARGSFGPLLGAAETDDVEIKEQRREWRQFQRLTARSGDILEHASWTLSELASLDVPALLPGFGDYAAELDARLAEVDRMLGGEAPTRQPAAVELAPDDAAPASLSQFERAALTVARLRLAELDELTRGLFACVAAIGDFDTPESPAGETAPARTAFVPDPDRLIAGVRSFVTVWLAWLAVIFLPDLPGGTAVASAAIPIGMVLATMPMLKVSVLYRPLVYGLIISGIVYMFVMPHLDGFLQLGPMIFVVTFGLCYVFYSPQQFVGRAMGLALFAMVAGIDNDQSYSFLSFATTALMWPLVLVIFLLASHVPVSPRPEKAFLRLLGRFFHSCDYLNETMGDYPYRPLSKAEQRRMDFHVQEISTLPAKLGAWSGAVSARGLEGTTPADVQALVVRLKALSNAIHGLLAVRARHQAEIVVEALRDDVRSWRLGVQSVAHGFALDPAYADGEHLRSRVTAVMEVLEEKITRTLDEAQPGSIDHDEAESLYRLLGAYRGVSEALIDFAGASSEITWAPWREERFA